jgi:hypothetical protein
MPRPRPNSAKINLASYLQKEANVSQCVARKMVKDMWDDMTVDEKRPWVAVNREAEEIMVLDWNI